MENMSNTTKRIPIVSRLTKVACLRTKTSRALTALKKFGLLWSVSLGVAGTLQAQNINATALISSQSAGGGLFNYTLTLNNLASSTSPIETFWFAWLPNDDNFLPSSPTSAQAPPGWNSSIITGSYYSYYYYYYDYSIEFTSSTAPLNPGHSLTFGFVSSDSPDVVEGDSSIYPGYKVDTSYLYSGVGAGNGAQVIPQVPEPSALSLLLAALVCFFISLRRSHCPPPEYTVSRFRTSSLGGRI
jgi:hypothetical protein